MCNAEEKPTRRFLLPLIDARTSSVTHLKFRPLEAALVPRIIILFRVRILRKIPEARAHSTAVNRECTIRSMIRKSQT